MVASERDAALVLLCSSLDSLIDITDPEHLACLWYLLLSCLLRLSPLLLLPLLALLLTASCC